MAHESVSEEQICSFNGVVNARTKPFVIAEGVEYFTIRWTTGSDDGEIELYSLEDSTYPVDRFSGSGPSESVWYASGKFFFAIKSCAEWSITVVIELEALSESDTDEISGDDEEVFQGGEANEITLLEREMQYVSLDPDQWFYVYAIYSQERFQPVIQAGFLKNVNSVFINPSENLISTDGLKTLRINSRNGEKLYEIAKNLHQTVLNLIPNGQDNYPQAATFPAIDEHKINATFPNIYKMRFEISKILAKCGSQGQKFTFGDALVLKDNPGVRLQLFTVTSDFENY